MAPHDIDIRKPGGIDALLAFHRAHFGDTRMEGEGTGTGDGTGTGAADAAKADAKAATDKTAADAAAAQDMKSLPEWAQKEIRDTRKEAAENRVGKAAAEKAAKDAKDIVDSISKAMNPGADTDPTKLAAQLEAANAVSRDANIRLAVFTAAAAAGANPVALLDRNSFTKALAGLDPSKATFNAEVLAAMTAAIASDPTLKAAPAAGASSTDHGAGGSGDQSGKRPTSIKAALSKAS